MPDDAVTPDDLVYSFLKAASERKVACLVLYGYSADGKTVTKRAANSDEKAGMSMLAKMAREADENAFEVAARAVHEKFGRIPGKWENLGAKVKAKYLDAVTTAFAAAQAHLALDKPTLVS